MSSILVRRPHTLTIPEVMRCVEWKIKVWAVAVYEQHCLREEGISIWNLTGHFFYSEEGCALKHANEKIPHRKYSLGVVEQFKVDLSSTTSMVVRMDNGQKVAFNHIR